MNGKLLRLNSHKEIGLLQAALYKEIDRHRSVLSLARQKGMPQDSVKNVEDDINSLERILRQISEDFDTNDL